MEEVLKGIKMKLEDCSKSKDFSGEKFKRALRELNYVFRNGDDEDSARACDILIDNNVVDHLVGCWRQEFSAGANAENDVVNTVKAVIWNCTDKYQEFVYACVANDQLIRLIVDEMKKYALNLSKLNDTWQRNAIRGDLGILHNLLRRNSSSSDILKKCDGPHTIVCFTRSNFLIIRTFALVVLAFCGDSSEMMTDQDSQFLTGLVTNARGARDHTHSEQGLSLEEILQFIIKLIARTPENKNTMVKHTFLQSLNGIITHGSYKEAEVLACLELLWELAVTDTSKQALLQAKGLVKEVEDCLKSTKTPTAIRKECGSLKYILTSGNQRQSTKHVMISYQWDSQELILELCRHLKEAGFRVWVDVDEMKGSLLTSMAEAVENAAVVLVGVTQKYGESENTQKEATYANDKKVPIIPLKLETKYDPCGWLGILVAGKLYVDLSDNPQDKFKKVEDQIESILTDASVCKK